LRDADAVPVLVGVDGHKLEVAGPQARYAVGDALKRLLPGHHAELGVLRDRPLAGPKAGVADLEVLLVLQGLWEGNCGTARPAGYIVPVMDVQAVVHAAGRTGLDQGTADVEDEAVPVPTAAQPARGQPDIITRLARRGLEERKWDAEFGKRRHG